MTRRLLPSITGPLPGIAAFAVVIAFLVLVRVFYGYLPFHVFAELFAIVLFFSVFLFGWHAHRIENGFVKAVATSLLFIGFLDALHTVTYGGMNLIPGYDANTPTQLWIAARSLQALSFLAGLFFLRRKFNKAIGFIVFAAVTALLTASIFYLRIFPDCLIGGKLTPFKIAAEYAICLVLAVSLVVLFLNRGRFDRGVRRFISLSLVFTILSELSFTLYNDPYDVFNFTGHFLKIAAVYLFFKAVFETGVHRPFDLVFKELKRREETLESALAKVKTLNGLLPICASCKKIRDDRGYWSQVELYLRAHADVEFSHGLCPDCYAKYAAQIGEGENGEP